MGKKNKKWKPLTYAVDNIPVQENFAVEEEDVREMLHSALEVIEKTVAKLDVSSNLASHPFFFIHVNAYVLVGMKIFYPCELAILKFSLQNGIEETYHKLINPGCLPVGFAHDALSYSEVTHRFPYPPLKEAVADFANILDEVQQFVWGGAKAVEEHRWYSQSTGEDLCLPPMYTFYDKELFHYDFVNEAVVFDLMQKLTGSSDTPCRFLIHPLVKLAYELQNTGALHAGVVPKWTNIQDVQDILEKDSFLYTPMLGCEFHEKIDASACCSLSLVKRWALTISSHCSALFEVVRPLVVHGDEAEAPAEACANSRTSEQQGQSNASWRSVSSRHKFPPRSRAKLRQPYASIQDMKPIQ